MSDKKHYVNYGDPHVNVPQSIPMPRDNLLVDHASWITMSSTKLSATEQTVTAWMRVQLMGNTSLRSWFYDASCKLCTNTATWKAQQKHLD